MKDEVHGQRHTYLLLAVLSKKYLPLCALRELFEGISTGSRGERRCQLAGNIGSQTRER